MNDIFIELEKNYSRQNKIFQASKYWNEKNNFIIKKIKSDKSIDNFRSNYSNLSSGFSDNMIIDYRREYNYKIYQKIISLLLNSFPLKNIFNHQVSLTNKYFSYLNHYRNLFFEKDESINFLIHKFDFDESVNFGCDNFIKLKGKNISLHHLFLAFRHFQISKHINFENVISYCEIGGGFGAYAEFILKNFPNVKKFLYVDIFSQIFFATMYLKKIFGENIIDLKEFKKRKTLFQDNDKLELVILPPNELEKLNYKFDNFHNAFSFQEMDMDQVVYYRDFIVKNSKQSTNYSFVFYGEESAETLSLETIEKIFNDISFKKESFLRLDKISKEIILIK